MTQPVYHKLRDVELQLLRCNTLRLELVEILDRFVGHIKRDGRLVGYHSPDLDYLVELLEKNKGVTFQ